MSTSSLDHSRQAFVNLFWLAFPRENINITVIKGETASFAHLNLELNPERVKAVITFLMRRAEDLYNANILFISAALKDQNFKKRKRTAVKYDRQIILNMEQRRDGGLPLAEKALLKGIPTSLIYLHILEDKVYRRQVYSIMQTATCASRVYLMGHAVPGIEYLSCKDKRREFPIKAIDLANLFTRANLKENAPRKLKISLIACHAAEKGPNGEKSFAENFSSALFSYKINAEVIARVGEIMVNAETGQKFTYDKGEFLHHAEGTKFAFITSEKGIQVRPVLKPFLVISECVLQEEGERRRATKAPAFVKSTKDTLLRV